MEQSAKLNKMKSEWAHQQQEREAHIREEFRKEKDALKRGDEEEQEEVARYHAGIGGRPREVQKHRMEG